MEIKQLNNDFGIAGQLEFVAGNGGFPFIKINNHSANALISIYGAQVLSFQPVAEAEDLLFLSQQSAYTEGKAIRGGIPLCWPWFGADPKRLHRANHGFVRNHFWQVADTEASSDGETKIKLLFNESFENAEIWHKPFTLILDITIGSSLSLNLTTYNTGDKAFSITQAFHSYFRISDIRRVQILGLAGCHYFDKLDQDAEKSQQGAVVITEEVDRIYTDPKNELIIVDAAFNRRIQISSTSTKTAVIWNPWTQAAPNISDLGNKAYKDFVCVEMGNIAFDHIEILPGEQNSLCANFAILPI
ncbi:MAG: D-hexose-6-phosphate mutarotase [Methylococcaceae bacterium]|nr:D-hexose-6-phosphate mutarotase [Methylococcaceae bacterium]